MFDSIKKALENTKTKQGGVFKNILQLAAPATYIVRLVPNVKKPEETFLHYFHHGWKSIKTGQFGSITSPSTWGERCPVSELYFSILRDGTEDEKKRAKDLIRRKENWLVNVYVVNDPTTPENNGTVKVLRFGRQLNKIIESAISGDDAAELGSKIFDLSPNGCSLRIKAELVSDKPGAPKFTSYTASKFLTPGPIEGLSDEKIPEILEGIYDLNTFVDHKTIEEIKEFVDAHYFNKGGETLAPSEKGKTTEEEDVPYVEAEQSKAVEPAAQQKAKTSAPTPVSDAKVKALLDGLDELDTKK